MNELSVVIPVYNEAGAIRSVLEKWTKKFDELRIDYVIHVYNDGSRDETLSILKKIAEENNKIRVHDKRNNGHGPTILLGYKENIDNNWIFQIDSDDEMGPEPFDILWSKRHDYDFLLGKRAGRNSPLPRKIISLISRLIIRILYGPGIWDVNSPYRLMRSNKFKELFNMIPSDTFAPNVIVSGYVCKKKMRIFDVEVLYKERQTGTVSIKKWRLLKAAIKSFWQTTKFAFKKYN